MFDIPIGLTQQGATGSVLWTLAALVAAAESKWTRIAKIESSGGEMRRTSLRPTTILRSRSCSRPKWSAS